MQYSINRSPYWQPGLVNALCLAVHCYDCNTSRRKRERELVGHGGAPIDSDMNSNAQYLEFTIYTPPYRATGDPSAYKLQFLIRKAAYRGRYCCLKPETTATRSVQYCMIVETAAIYTQIRRYCVLRYVPLPDRNP